MVERVRNNVCDGIRWRCTTCLQNQQIYLGGKLLLQVKATFAEMADTHFLVGTRVSCNGCWKSSWGGCGHSCRCVPMAQRGLFHQALGNVNHPRWSGSGCPKWQVYILSQTQGINKMRALLQVDAAAMWCCRTICETTLYMNIITKVVMQAHSEVYTLPPILCTLDTSEIGGQIG